MLGNRKLVLDTFCEVYDLLNPYADAEFWEFSKHEFMPGAIYIFGRTQFLKYKQQIIDITDQQTTTIVLSNPAEGSETLTAHCTWWGITELIKNNKILLIGGGDMASNWSYIQYDSFLPKLLDYEENILAGTQVDKIYSKTSKPYNFLFLNGRFRPHRKYLLEQLNLTHAIWTNLDQGNGPVHYLDPKYEVDLFKNRIETPTNQTFVKTHLFNNIWGEIYLTPAPYIDTYFSLVTETVFNYPYSFRTEKIWKPVVMGHPWIVAANQGYYRDIRNLGFQTFSHVIDESFDLIENNQDRIERIVQVVEDLCQQDLASFLKECYNVCKYNQQHLTEMRIKVRQEFPDRFHQFINSHLNE